MKLHIRYLPTCRVWVCYDSTLRGTKEKIYKFSQGDTPVEAYEAYKDMFYSHQQHNNGGRP